MSCRYYLKYEALIGATALTSELKGDFTILRAVGLTNDGMFAYTLSKYCAIIVSLDIGR